MKQFHRSLEGYSAQLEPAEAVLIAGAMEELAQAFGAEAGRDYVAQMLDDELGRTAHTGQDQALNPQGLDSSDPENHKAGGFPASTKGLFGSFDTHLPRITTPLSTPEEKTPEVVRRYRENKNGASASSHNSSSSQSSSEKNLSDSDEDVLAALDFEPLPPRPEPQNPVIGAILKPLSQDPEVAAELRALTMPGLCQTKRAALLSVAAEIRRAGRQGNLVRVTEANLGQWLSALNDLRVSLAWALNITDDERADQVYRLATAGTVSGQDTVLEYEQSLAALYTALSWWQESLLSCAQ